VHIPDPAAPRDPAARLSTNVGHPAILWVEVHHRVDQGSIQAFHLLIDFFALDTDGFRIGKSLLGHLVDGHDVSRCGLKDVVAATRSTGPPQSLPQNCE